MKKPVLILSLLAIAISVLSLPRLLVAQTAPSEDSKKSLMAQKERAGVVFERGSQPHYTQKFDLSGMPHYEPK
ncbi:MAG TPA: hypothetical protein VKC60_07350, partial [Opitutaceae bacterium]|nr:hypothetical protein [Opitutaceae bacterium]